MGFSPFVSFSAILLQYCRKDTALHAEAARPLTMATAMIQPPQPHLLWARWAKKMHSSGGDSQLGKPQELAELFHLVPPCR